MRLSIFLSAAALALAASTAAQAQTSGSGKLDFGLIDTDKDGALSAAELVAIMPAFAGQTAADQLVAAKDENGDGLLTLAELSSPVPVPTIRLAPEIAIMAPFAVADLNSDGGVTLAELDAKGSGGFAGLHALYIRQADKNGDGSISKAEWEAERPTMTVTAASHAD